MTELNFNIVIFKSNFNGLWNAYLYNSCYSSLNPGQFLTTELMYTAISVLLKDSNNICLDQYQTDKILSNNYRASCIEKQPEIKLANSKRYVIIPRCERSHWILGIIDFEEYQIITYDPLNPARVLHNFGNQLKRFANQILQFYDSCDHNKHFKIISCIFLPQQKDGCNCGVYAIYAVEHLLFNKHIMGIHSDDECINLQSLNNYRNYLKQQN